MCGAVMTRLLLMLGLTHNTSRLHTALGGGGGGGGGALFIFFGEILVKWVTFPGAFRSHNTIVA